MISITNQPFSEQYRLAYEEWADLHHRAGLLERMHPVLRKRRALELQEADTKLSYTRAEALVEASEWHENYVREMLDAKKRATDAYGKVEYIDRLSWEHSRADANRRAEMRL